MHVTQAPPAAPQALELRPVTQTPESAPPRGFSQQPPLQAVVTAPHTTSHLWVVKLQAWPAGQSPADAQGGTHTRFEQMPLVQSASVPQCLPFAHFGQVPPQSTSVSAPSWKPSWQVGVRQVPAWHVAVVQSLGPLQVWRHASPAALHW